MKRMAIIKRIKERTKSTHSQQEREEYGRIKKLVEEAYEYSTRAVEQEKLDNRSNPFIDQGASCQMV